MSHEMEEPTGQVPTQPMAGQVPTQKTAGQVPPEITPDVPAPLYPWESTVPWQPPVDTGTLRRHPMRWAALGGTLALVVALTGFGVGRELFTPETTNRVAAGGSLGPASGRSPLGTFGGGRGLYEQSPYADGSSSTGVTATGSGGPSDVSAIAAKADPALVDVVSTFGYQGAKGAGTGIVLTSSGEVLTNNHVIDGATKISVTDLGNHKTYSATVVGYDASHDIAVLQLKGASGLSTAARGDSSTASVGQPVVAIGNAGGVGGTPSAAGGSITALGQSITAGNELDGTSEQLTGLIQVNADVQPGDSGGALVDTGGQVIGMNTAAASGLALSAGSQGFAIPINLALATASQIESGQGTSAVHVGPSAFLGILMTSGAEGAAAGPSGATVGAVVPGLPAQRAGLVAGDLITSLGGHAVSSANALGHLMVGYHPGDRVSIHWVGPAGRSHSATVVLGSGPAA